MRYGCFSFYGLELSYTYSTLHAENILLCHPLWKADLFLVPRPVGVDMPQIKDGLAGCACAWLKNYFAIYPVNGYWRLWWSIADEKVCEIERMLEKAGLSRVNVKAFSDRDKSEFLAGWFAAGGVAWENKTNPYDLRRPIWEWGHNVMTIPGASHDTSAEMLGRMWWKRLEPMIRLEELEAVAN